MDSFQALQAFISEFRSLYPTPSKPTLIFFTVILLIAHTIFLIHLARTNKRSSTSQNTTVGDEERPQQARVRFDEEDLQCRRQILGFADRFSDDDLEYDSDEDSEDEEISESDDVALDEMGYPSFVRGRVARFDEISELDLNE